MALDNGTINVWTPVFALPSKGATIDQVSLSSVSGRNSAGNIDRARGGCVFGGDRLACVELRIP